MAGEASQQAATLTIKLQEDEGGRSGSPSSLGSSLSGRPDATSGKSLGYDVDAVAHTLKSFQDAVEAASQNVRNHVHKAQGSAEKEVWQLERERMRAALDWANANESAYHTKLADAKAFDPTDIAMRKINAEDRSKQIQTEYDRLSGKAPKKEEEFARKLTVLITTLTTLFQTLHTFIVLSKQYEQGQADSIVRDRNTILDRINATKANTEAIASGIVAASTVAGSAYGAGVGTAAGGPAGGVVGGLIGAGAGYAAGQAAAAAVRAVGEALTAVDEKFLKFRDALAESSKKFAPYSGPLAGAIAARENASRQMDISEAALFGPDFADFTRAQSKLDIEMRRATQLGILAEIKENTKQANEKAEKIRKANEKLLETMDAETRRKFEEAERNRKDPLTEFLDGLELPEDHRGIRDIAIRTHRQKRDIDLAGPVFGGN